MRQGCPLSPLLFVVCVDILLRRLERLFHATTCTAIPRAFADDTAVVISDLRFLSLLLQVYVEFGAISNLYLNMDKTVLIPLWWEVGVDGNDKTREDTLACIRARILAAHPSWATAIFSWYGIYLGNATGPGRRHGYPGWIKA